MNTLAKTSLEKIQQVDLKVLCEKYQIQAIVLFGSILTDAFHEVSDVDIALLGEKVLTLKEVLNIEFYFEKLLDREIDVVDLRGDNLDIFIKINILDNGKCIFTTDHKESLEVYIDEVADYYRKNRDYFDRRRRDVLC